MSAFITIKKDGTVIMDGGLIFHNKDYSLFIENGNVGSGYRFTNNMFMGSIPKWYQFIEWFRVFRMIRRLRK